MPHAASAIEGSHVRPKHKILCGFRSAWSGNQLVPAVPNQRVRIEQLAATDPIQSLSHLGCLLLGLRCPLPLPDATFQPGDLAQRAA